MYLPYSRGFCTFHYAVKISPSQIKNPAHRALKTILTRAAVENVLVKFYLHLLIEQRYNICKANYIILSAILKYLILGSLPCKAAMRADRYAIIS